MSFTMKQTEMKLDEETHGTCFGSLLAGGEPAGVGSTATRRRAPWGCGQTNRRMECEKRKEENVLGEDCRRCRSSSRSAAWPRNCDAERLSPSADLTASSKTPLCARTKTVFQNTSFSFSFSCSFSSPYSGAMTYVAQYMMQASLLQRSLRTPFVF